MKSFCLIIPPSIFLLDERVFPFLGVLKVASALEATGAHVEVLDLSGIANFEEVVAGHIHGSAANTFGVTATTPQLPAAHKILAVLRRVRPDAKCILGGPHPTLVLAAQKREAKSGREARGHRSLERLLTDWDQIVAGDGENAIVGIAEGRFEDVRIIDADDPKGNLFLTKQMLEETPAPARHLIDLPSYHYKIEGHEATSLICQLGCPYKCAFCAGRYSPMLRRIRTRSVENVVEEVEHVNKTYGITGFMFYDDELNVSKDMIRLMNGLTDLQMRLGTEFRLRGFVKSELFTQEQAEAMYRAGFRWLLCGYESGSERILENIAKNATRQDNSLCAEIGRKAGLKIKALMSIGHAGESEETCRDTERWLYETRPDDFDVTIITPYPGSPYYDDTVETSPKVWTFTCEKSGDRLHGIEIDYNEVADYYKGDPDGGYSAYVFTDYLTSKQLVELRGEMEQNIRARLGIPWNPSVAAMKYEHSMGQTGLPPNMLRISQARDIEKNIRLKVL